MTASRWWSNAKLAVLAGCVGAFVGAAALGDEPGDEPLRAASAEIPLALNACARVNATTSVASAGAQLQVGSPCATNETSPSNGTGAPGNATTPDEAPTAPPPTDAGGTDGGSSDTGGPDPALPADGAAPPGTPDAEAGAPDADVPDAGSPPGSAGNDAGDAPPGSAGDPPSDTDLFHRHQGAWVPGSRPTTDEAANATDGSNATDHAADAPANALPNLVDVDGATWRELREAGAAPRDASGGESRPTPASGNSTPPTGGPSDGAVIEETPVSDAPLAWRAFEPARSPSPRAPDAPRAGGPCAHACEAPPGDAVDSWQRAPMAHASATPDERGLFARLVDSVRGYLGVA